LLFRGVMSAQNQNDADVLSGKLRQHPAAGGAALGTAAFLGFGSAFLLLGSADAKIEPRRRFFRHGLRQKASKGKFITGGAAISGGVAGAFVLLDAILTHRKVVRLDRHLHNYFRQRRTRAAERAVEATTAVGEGWFVVPIAALSAWGLARGNDVRAATTVLWSVAGASAWTKALKNVIRRKRPTEGAEQSDGYSFPSGHTLLAGSLYGLLAYVLGTNKDFGRWRFPAAAALAMIGPWTAFSRMYLGRHWMSDTAASAALATAWNATLITFLRSR
jgi:undecaprenyl-diphosphatase